MSRTHRAPSEQVVLSALGLAVRAPSVHNSQPWRWHVSHTEVHLFADQSKRLPMTDPDGRDLVMSCGTALHHFRIALAAFGWATQVHRLPDPTNPDHLATIGFMQQTPNDDEIELASAIPRRRTDRRRYASWPVPSGLLDLLARDAADEGVMLRPVTDSKARFHLVNAIIEADQFQRANPGYLRELAQWAGREGREPVGVPAANIARPAAGPGTRAPMRHFPVAGLAQPEGADLEEDESVLLVLGGAADNPLTRLRAGEATSAALLRATSLGLANCPLSQPLEVRETRELVHRQVVDANICPQMILRVGWTHLNADPLPATPRRPLSEVVDGILV